MRILPAAIVSLVALAGCSAPLPPVAGMYHDVPPPIRQDRTLSATVYVADDVRFYDLMASCREMMDGMGGIDPRRIGGFVCRDHGAVRFVAVRASYCSTPAQMEADIFCHEFKHVEGWNHAR